MGLEPEDAGEGDEEQGFGEPEGFVAEVRGGPGAEQGSGEEEDADDGELAGLGEFAAADFGVGMEEAVGDAFGDLADVAGDEGGVVGEAADGAKGGDLEGGDEGDGGGEDGLGEGGWREAGEEEDGHLEEQDGERGLELRPDAKQAGGGDAEDKGQDGCEMAQGLRVVLLDERDAEEDDVAGEGVGEDMAVEDEDGGVEQAADGGEERGAEEGIGLGFVEGVGHAGFIQAKGSMRPLGCEGIL